MVQVPHLGADGPRHHLGTPVRHLMIRKGRMQQHLVIRPAQRLVIGDVMGVAVVLAAIPQHLDQGKAEVAIQIVGVGQIKRQRIRRESVEVVRLVEINTPPQQRGVVHADHAQHAAGDVLGQGHHRTTADAALRVAVVKDLAVGKHRLPRLLERRVGAEPIRVA